jgi:hypothetical protein
MSDNISGQVLNVRELKRISEEKETAKLEEVLAQIIAFSDPNDLMSYPVPDQFADRYIESRLCRSVTNVTINVAS